MTEFENINADEARRLVESGDVNVLDVRTAEEFERLGHIHGAMHLPVDFIASGLATLPRDRPLLVYCEHGVRSAFAARLLVAGGFEAVLNLAGGMVAWTGPRNHAPGVVAGSHGPSSWLIENVDLLPVEGRVLDVACGRGRHALLLAAAGFDVYAVDNNEERVRELRESAALVNLSLSAEVLDLEAPGRRLVETPGSDREGYDVIVIVHYLHRPLFPALIEALRPGGVLVYETFTVRQKERGRPRNPAYLLEPGELETLVRPLEVLRRREGDFEGRFVASVVARKPAAKPPESPIESARRNAEKGTESQNGRLPGLAEALRSDE